MKSLGKKAKAKPLARSTSQTKAKKTGTMAKIAQLKKTAKKALSKGLGLSNQKKPLPKEVQKHEKTLKKIPGTEKKTAAAPSPVKASTQAARVSKAAVAVSVAAREAENEAVCREVACEGLATSGGYCRMHYIKNWKKIKRKELILKEKKLNQYIEELVAKYPDKYIEAIRQDLASDKDFSKVIHDLDLDEGIDDFDVDGEPMEALIDNIKRDFDDEGEGF